MNKEELITSLRKTCDKVALNRKIMLAVSEDCYHDYGVPQNETMDVINDRVSLDQKSDDFLFFLSAVLTKHVEPFYLSAYYSKQEIDEYSKKQYAMDGDYEFIIPCFMVSFESGKQWIGVLDARDILRLDRDGKINYNYEKQRVRQRAVKGDEVVFSTKINTRSVIQIANLMENREYIPDCITLDIPFENEKNDYRYDDTRHLLYFKNLDSLDITDGYHRLEAMRRCYGNDKNFSYPMEIQITQFTVQRTQQFIYQTDQKNKMMISQSKSFDSMRPSNEVCNFLNDDSGCLFNRLIKRSGNNTIDYVALSDIIEYYYFGKWLGDSKDRKKEFSRQDVLDVAKKVKDLINTFGSENPEYIGKFIGFPELMLYFYLIMNKQKKPTEAAKTVKKSIDNGKIKEITLRGVRSTLFNQMDKIKF